MVKQVCNILWFKRDLRIQDHLPLFHALNSQAPILAIYIFEPLIENSYDFDDRHWQFVYESLSKIKTKIPLTLFYGNAEDIFESLFQRFEIHHVFSSQETGVLSTFKRDLSIKRLFNSYQIKWHEFQTNGVVRGLRNREAWDAAWIQWMSTPVEEIKIDLDRFVQIESIPFDLPEKLIERIKINHFQPAGFDIALENLDQFLKEKVGDYWNNISYPDKSRYHSSRLSPYISWGNISIRQIYQASRKYRPQIKNKMSLDQFIARLKWQSHFIQKFEMEMEMEFKNLNPAFDHIRQKENKDFIKAWKRGMTGYPLVDAAMRCVEKTGFLNFRLRAMVVSFLTHLLWQPWQPGARHLARMFLDYEPGIHFPQFQMQAGTTGVNTIRIYNPIKQSLEKDQDAKFILEWVPELKGLPVNFVHEPWAMTSMDEMLYGFKLGENYPRPIVNFEVAYKNAQDKLWKLKKSDQTKEHSKKILRKHVRSRSS